MKHAVGRAILSPEFQNSILGSLVRSIVRRTRRLYPYSGQFLTDFNVVERPHYAYCMLGAARLANRLCIDRISVIEFGVAGGNGLKFMCDFAEIVQRTTGVAVDCYGFDTGHGMPNPKGPKDLPYWFRASQYKMDVAALRERVPKAKLVLGEIGDTLRDFLRREDPAPIGAIMNDVDYYSSTISSLSIFNESGSSPKNFLPRIFMYYDDIIGTELEMYGPFNGQLAAIDKFNNDTENCKIHLNQNLLAFKHLPFRLQIYYAHIFDHPDYGKYIGGAQQLDLERHLRLRAGKG